MGEEKVRISGESHRGIDAATVLPTVNPEVEKQIQEQAASNGIHPAFYVV